MTTEALQSGHKGFKCSQLCFSAGLSFSVCVTFAAALKQEEASVLTATTKSLTAGTPFTLEVKLFLSSLFVLRMVFWVWSQARTVRSRLPWSRRFWSRPVKAAVQKQEETRAAGSVSEPC